MRPSHSDQRPPDEQEYLRLHHNLLSRYRFYLAQLPKLVPIHAAAAWRYTHQLTSDLPLHAPRCWADGPLKLRDASMKISDLNSWAEFSTVLCVIDLPPAERGARDEGLSARVRYQGIVERLVEYVRCGGQGWVERARGVLKAAARQWDEEIGPFPWVLVPPIGGWLSIMMSYVECPSCA